MVKDQSVRALSGLGLGILVGLLLGTYAGWLAWIGDIYVGLLRMTVLPYITLALVKNFAKLGLAASGRFVRVGLLALLFLWSHVLVALVVLPICLPSQQQGGYFLPTAGLTQPTESFGKLLVPNNFFSALANDQVPAIVTLSIIFGLVLSQHRNRQPLIEQLETLTSLLVKTTAWIARLTPLGIFAIAASVVGKTQFEQLAKLSSYVVLYSAAAVFLGFVVLPCFIATMTRFRYRDILRVTREPAIIAFVSGKLMVVLPMIIENMKQLASESESEREAIAQKPSKTETALKSGEPTAEDDPSPHEASSEVGNPPRTPSTSRLTAELLCSTVYTFPHIGKLLSLLFIPFAAWFVGRPLPMSDLAILFGVGSASYFAGPLVAVPYLLEVFHLPEELFDLFLLVGIVGERFGDALGVMHVAAFGMLCFAIQDKHLTLGTWSLLKTGLGVTLLAICMVMGLQFALAFTVDSSETRNAKRTRQETISIAVSNRLLRQGTPNPDGLLPDESVLQRVRRRETIRIGYNAEKYPFAYFRSDGELVGFDVSMAHALANDLDVAVEFVPFNRDAIAEAISADHFDVVMSGVIGSFERIEQLTTSDAYLDIGMGLVARDTSSRSFSRLSNLRRRTRLRIGYVEINQPFMTAFASYLPNAEWVLLDRNEDFFSADSQTELDALLVNVEQGVFLVRERPNYDAIIVDQPRISLPLVYVLHHGDRDFQDFIDHWIRLKQDDGTVERLYNQWVLGKDPNDSQPRIGLLPKFIETIRNSSAR